MAEYLLGMSLAHAYEDPPGSLDHGETVNYQQDSDWIGQRPPGKGRPAQESIETPPPGEDESGSKEKKQKDGDRIDKDDPQLRHGEKIAWGRFSRKAKT